MRRERSGLRKKEFESEKSLNLGFAARFYIARGGRRRNGDFFSFGERERERVWDLWRRERERARRCEEQLSGEGDDKRVSFGDGSRWLDKAEGMTCRVPGCVI